MLVANSAENRDLTFHANCLLWRSMQNVSDFFSKMTDDWNSTHHPLYNMVHYSTVLNIRQFKNGPKKCCIQTKMYRLFRKMTFYGHFSIKSLGLLSFRHYSERRFFFGVLF